MAVRNITIKQLRAFVAITEASSFVEAGTAIHLSQPALSSLIKNLEDQVGGRLLVRTTRRNSLTPEGESFLPVARQLLADWDESIQDLSALFSLKRGKLSICAMPSYASTRLPAELGRFRAEHPNIKIVVHDLVAETVVALVRSGRVELGLTFWPGDEQDLEFTPLFDDRFMAAVPASHPLAQHASVKWDHLRNQSLILLQLPSSIRKQIDTVLEEHELSSAVDLESHQLSTIGRMVAQGLGISIIPALYQEQMREMGAVCLPLLKPELSRRVGILVRRNYPLSTAGAAFMRMLSDA